MPTNGKMSQEEMGRRLREDLEQLRAMTDAGATPLEFLNASQDFFVCESDHSEGSGSRPIAMKSKGSPAPPCPDCGKAMVNTTDPKVIFGMGTGKVKRLIL